MGKLQLLNSSKSTSAMDIDPRPSSWNSLCPTFIDARSKKLLQDQSSRHVIGSPPPAGSQKVCWDAHPVEVSNLKGQEAESSMGASELSSLVQGIRLQPPQPMIICEIIEDAKVNPSVIGAGSSVSLAVPPVDLTNEKKRPPY